MGGIASPNCVERPGLWPYAADGMWHRRTAGSIRKHGLPSLRILRHLVERSTSRAIGVGSEMIREAAHEPVGP